MKQPKIKPKCTYPITKTNKKHNSLNKIPSNVKSYTGNCGNIIFTVNQKMTSFLLPKSVHLTVFHCKICSLRIWPDEDVLKGRIIMIFTFWKRQLGRFRNSVSATGSHTPPSSQSRFSERSAAPGRSPPPPQRSPHTAALILSLCPVIMFQTYEIFPTVRGIFNLRRC